MFVLLGSSFDLIAIALAYDFEFRNLCLLVILGCLLLRFNKMLGFLSDEVGEVLGVLVVV